MDVDQRVGKVEATLPTACERYGSYRPTGRTAGSRPNDASIVTKKRPRESRPDAMDRSGRYVVISRREGATVIAVKAHAGKSEHSPRNSECSMGERIINNADLVCAIDPTTKIFLKDPT